MPSMKRERFLTHVLLALGLALGIYALLFGAIEHRRNRQGPWRVAFTAAANAAPCLIVNQTALGITNVQLVFGAAPAPTHSAVVVDFAQARATPFPTPYGRCVFLDTLSLPGTVVLELFGHQVQFMPRVLTIDRAERPWRSDEVIRLPAGGLSPLPGAAAAPPPPG
jgi:hypothetical protein